MHDFPKTFNDYHISTIKDGAMFVSLRPSSGLNFPNIDFKGQENPFIKTAHALCKI